MLPTRFTKLVSSSYIKKFKILIMSSTVNQLQLLTIKIFQQVLNNFKVLRVFHHFLIQKYLIK